MRRLAHNITPEFVLEPARRVRRRLEHPLVKMRTRFGQLRRREPMRRCFGWGAGQCVDRYYIERFLDQHRDDLRGRVLEIGDDRYTRAFGSDSVAESLVLHRDPEPNVDIVADLANADHIPSNAFDCVIIPNTLQYIFDVHAAVRALERILRPRGVVLAAVPGITQISGADQQRYGEYWRFTPESMERLFGEAFGEGVPEVEAFGNVATSVAFLHGVVAEELSTDDLDYRDPLYPMVIVTRAQKSAVTNEPADTARVPQPGLIDPRHVETPEPVPGLYLGDAWSSLPDASCP